MVYLVCKGKKIFIFVFCLFLVILAATGWFTRGGSFFIRECEAPVLNVEVQENEEIPLQKIDVDQLAKQEFFVDCRLVRDRIRSSQAELLNNIADNPASGVESRDQAQQQLMKITERVGYEMELEQLVAARGLRDVVVLIQERSATVIVRSSSLTDVEVGKIKEMVGRVTDLEVGSIYVVTKL